jgi:hypothetical protein
VQQQAPTFVQQQLQQQKLNRGEAVDLLKEDIALALCSCCSSVGRCTSVSTGQMPCCFSEQLPKELMQLGEWCISRPRARSAPRGQQRAEAGTSAPRNFNFGSNTPYKLKNTLKLLQLLLGDEAAAAAAARPDLFLIRSAHMDSEGRVLVCFAVAKLSEMAAAGSDFWWDREAAKCNKRAYKGKHFDLLNAAFICCIGEQAAAGSKRKAGE